MDFPRKQHNPLKSKITNGNNGSYDSDIVEFQITDIFVPENDRYKEKDNDELYTLLIFGTREDGATFCVNVKNFCPFFYIKPSSSLMSYFAGRNIWLWDRYYIDYDDESVIVKVPPADISISLPESTGKIV